MVSGSVVATVVGGPEVVVEDCSVVVEDETSAAPKQALVRRTSVGRVHHNLFITNTNYGRVELVPGALGSDPCWT